MRRTTRLVVATLCLPALIAVAPVALAEEATPDPIALAREAATGNPEDAEAQMALARLLGNEMRSNPMSAMQYVPDFIASLEKAITLEPKNVEAYNWLAGFYMSAPPIAGGSLVKAREVADRLVAQLPEAGAELVALVENHQPEAAGGH